VGALIGNLPGQTLAQKSRANIYQASFSPLLSSAGTQALVRPGSPHSSISAEDRTSMASCICKAKALVDSLPNPYDKEALKFKVSCWIKQNIVLNFHLKFCLKGSNPLAMRSFPNYPKRFLQAR